MKRLAEAEKLFRFLTPKTPWWLVRVDWPTTSHESIVGNSITPAMLCLWVEQGAKVTILHTLVPA